MSSIYIHIPFCEKKCLYCDFYSIENHDSMDRFLAALENEIRMTPDQFHLTEPVDTIFFGGGTPSLLSPSKIEKLVAAVASIFTLAASPEITIETNPGTVDRSKLRGYRSAGVNRLSIGIQSFHADELQFLSRIHNAEEAIKTVRNAQEEGFDNISVDLIYGLPGQSEERWRNNLRQAFALQPVHISAYSLIVEENTPLFRLVQDGNIQPSSDDETAILYEITMEMMDEAGYRQYEVSNYAQHGYQCHHNRNYWNHTNYFGFGPSSHSFFKTGRSAAKRWWNFRSIQHYCELIERTESAVEGSESLTEVELLKETVFLGLRTGSLNFDEIKKQFGKDLFIQKNKKILQYLDAKFLILIDSTIHLTRRGYLLCDEIAAALT
jgi:oxygen-independent coproporphyrinogen-3 oxidase